MGCVNGKFSPRRNVDKLKHDSGYARRGHAPKSTSHTQDSYRHVGVAGLEVVETRRSSVSVRKSNSTGVVGGGEREREREREREGEGERKGEKEKEKVAAREEKSQVGNVSRRLEEKKIARYESVHGWPKWLVDNIPSHVLDKLVPKSVDSYEKLDKVGRGTYSNVYKARDKGSGKIVALKKVRFDTSDSESIKFMAREIMILQALDHPNVIKLEGLATSRMQYSLYLVFEFMQSDLTRIISRPGERLTEAQIKRYMLQLLSGLEHCHDRRVMHRDIKASNLLIDKKGNLKIADFGLANSFDIKPKGPFTNRVVTLWYRAPELLLGSSDYGFGIDLWSVGCLLAEMFVGKPIMPGRTEVEQLHMIFKLCGSPSEDYWNKMKLMTSYRPPQYYKPNFKEIFQDFPASSLSLLTTLLDLDPDHRGCAASALQSEFFKSSPLPCDLSASPVIYEDEDERTQTKRRKRYKGLKKGRVSQTSKSPISQSGKNQTAEQRSRDSESSKVEIKNMEQNVQIQETGNSASSTSSGSRLYINEGSLNTSLSLSSDFLSNVRKFPKTEAHPNALKNLKNYMEKINRKEGNESGLFRRSVSTPDFLDPEILSNFYGKNKKLGLRI